MARKLRKLRKLSLGSRSAWFCFLSDLVALFGLVDLNITLLPVVPDFSAGIAHFWSEHFRLEMLSVRQCQKGQCLRP